MDFDSRLTNDSWAAVRSLPLVDRKGRDVVVSIAKVAYEVSPRGRVTLAQRPVRFNTVYDDCGSIKFPEDSAADEKPGTDVALVGTAHPPRGKPVERMLAWVSCAHLRKVIAVHGPRKYISDWKGPVPGPAGKLGPTPLGYHLTFGGQDHSGGQFREETHNPLGRGFAAEPSTLPGSDAPLLECVVDPLQLKKPHPSHACFAPIREGWDPRRSLTGTYDDTWSKTRAPVRPRDFDARHHNWAVPELHSEAALEPDIAVEVGGVLPQGLWQFRLPHYSVAFSTVIAGEKAEHKTHLDSVLIDADERVVELTWRISCLLPKYWGRLERILVRSVGRLPNEVLEDPQSARAAQPEKSQPRRRMRTMQAVDNGEIELSLAIGGRTFRTIRCEIEEGLSEAGKVTVEIVSDDDIDFHPMLEADSLVIVTTGGHEARRLTLQLGSATFLKLENASLHYELCLYPAFWFLRLGTNTRKFRDEPTESIVSKVLGEQGIAHEWRNRRKSNSRPYTVQYRESNFAFVSRLLEYEGCYYYFEPDGLMVIGDTSSAEPPVPGKAIFELRETDGALAHGELGITSLEKGARVGPGRATVNDYSFKTPHISLLKTAASAKDEDLDVYEYMIGYRDPGVGATLAKLRVDGHVAEKRHVKGTSTVPSFAPGRRFVFEHVEALDFSGGYTLVRLSHKYKSKTATDPKASYDNRFVAIPEAVPFRPKVTTPIPNIQGNHTVMVRGPEGEEIHTDQYGRAKVQFHWDREAKGTDEDSRWLRVVQETSSSMTLSRVGWEIVAGYVDGDPDRPVGLGRNINGKMMPTYDQPSKKNIMTIKTETYPGKQGFNEVRLDDTAGAMRMDFHAQRDLSNVVENDRTEKIMGDHTALVKKGVDHVVEQNQTLHVSGNETRDVQEDYNETIKGDRKEDIGGDEIVNVKVSTMMTVKQDDKEKVSGDRKTLTGVPGVTVPEANEIADTTVPHTLGVEGEDISGGLEGDAVSDETESPEGSPESIAEGEQDEENVAIKRDTRQKLERKIGGSYMAIAGQTIVNGANYLFQEIVGGSKLTTSLEGSIAQTASKFLIHKVKALILRKSKEDMSMSAKKSVVNVKGMAIMHSDETVEMRSKFIEIEAKESVTFQAPDGLLIELKPEKTTIKGDIKVKSGQTIRYVGDTEELTA